MPTIKIHRKKDWSLKVGYNSTSEVLLDGQKIGYVTGGETTEFDVAAGQHTLKIKMGHYGSRDYNFNLFSKETKLVTVSSLRPYVTVVGILLLIVLEFLHLVLKIHLSKTVIYIILASIGALAICFQIFGRNAYLFIKENKG
jgi:hypothetical protein